MRAYYVGDAKARLDKLTWRARSSVVAHARNEAMRLSSPLDIAGHLFAILPRHLDECGFKSKKRPLSARKLMIEAFVAYVDETGFPSTGQPLAPAQIRKQMRMPGTYVYAEFQSFASGWAIGRASR